jgi:FixJ family two-component response regulator
MSTIPLIHVVDDDSSMRSALLRLLVEVGFEAHGYASTGEFLLQPLPDRPGCLLLDLRLPGPSGLDLQAALLQKNIMLPIVFLSGHGNVDSSVKAMKAGAVDFLTKPVKREILLDAVQRALARDATLRTAREEADRLHGRFASLTARQRDVFALIVAGKLNKQIADALGIAERTVKREREQVMAKLDANSAADLGRMAELLERSTAG